MTNIPDRQTFIATFQDKFRDSFDHIEEKYDEQADFYSYHIQLKEGIDKNEFLQANFQYIVDNTDFEDAFDLWFNEFGDDIETEGSILSVNAEFNDDEFEDERDAEANQLERANSQYAYSIDINGITYNVQNNQDDVAPAECSIFSENHEFLGSIYPDYDEAGNATWITTDNIDLEVVKKIGERIKQENL